MVLRPQLGAFGPVSSDNSVEQNILLLVCAGLRLTINWLVCFNELEISAGGQREQFDLPFYPIPLYSRSLVRHLLSKVVEKKEVRGSESRF